MKTFQIHAVIEVTRSGNCRGLVSIGEMGDVGKMEIITAPSFDSLWDKIKDYFEKVEGKANG